MFECNEKSSFCLDIDLTDNNGNALNPIHKIEWWVGKPRQDDPVIEKQEVESPSASLTITIPKEANICTSGRDEERFVIIRVESTPYVKHIKYDYVVLNLGLVPYPIEEEV